MTDPDLLYCAPHHTPNDLHTVSLSVTFVSWGYQEEDL